MDSLETLVQEHFGILLIVALFLVFGGIGRIAFWRERDGLRVGGPLVLGLALLLTPALFFWAQERHYSVADLGLIALLLVFEAIVILAVGAFWKGLRG